MSKQPTTLHRMVIEVDKAEYQKLRGFLLTNKGQTVSEWIRSKISEELNTPAKGQYRTRYGKASIIR